jgi:hypothetical protein
VTPGAAASEGKKMDEGTMTWLLEPEPNPRAVADRPDARTLTLATTQQVSHILTNGKISF